MNQGLVLAACLALPTIAGAKIDESTAVVAYQTMDGWTVTYVAAPADKAASAGATYRIAGCPM